MDISRFFIEKEDCIFVIIDVQEKLARTMKEEVLDSVIKNIIKLIELCKITNIPMIITEQYPKGLGKTLEQITNSINQSAIEKVFFSCMGEEKFSDKIKELKRNSIILAGMETHVCVWQTALDMLVRDYKVFVPKDAVCSRRKEDWKTALELIKESGGVVTCTESLIFQILKRAGTDEFKKMLEFVK